MFGVSKGSTHPRSLPTSFTTGNSQFHSMHFMKNLGFTLDCHLTMNIHVSTIARSYSINRTYLLKTKTHTYSY